MFLWVLKIVRVFDKPVKLIENLKWICRAKIPMLGYNRNFGAITNLGQRHGLGYPLGVVQWVTICLKRLFWFEWKTFGDFCRCNNICQQATESDASFKTLYVLLQTETNSADKHFGKILTLENLYFMLMCRESGGWNLAAYPKLL